MNRPQIRFLDDELRISKLDWIISNIASIVATEPDIDNRDVLIACMQELSYRQAILRRELNKK